MLKHNGWLREITPSPATIVIELAIKWIVVLNRMVSPNQDSNSGEPRINLYKNNQILSTLETQRKADNMRTTEQFREQQ